MPAELPVYLLYPCGRLGHKRLESCRSHVGVISDSYYTKFVETNASAATREQEADGISNNL